MANNRIWNTAASGGADGTFSGGIASRLGMQVTMDFLTWCALNGFTYQLRAGTITTPLVGDVVVTDTAAEFCVDVPSGTTILPLVQNVSIRLGTGTLHEYATKSVATASSAGTAFVPLALRPFTGAGAANAASVCAARVQAAGAVTVTAELATTTRRHWSYSNPVAVGAGNEATLLPWEPKGALAINGIWCLYTQIAATGTGPSYYANLDWIEMPTAALM